MHSVSTLSEQTTPTWKNVSDTNFQVRPVEGVGLVKSESSSGKSDEDEGSPRHPMAAPGATSVTFVRLLPGHQCSVGRSGLGFPTTRRLDNLGALSRHETCEAKQGGSRCNLGRLAALCCVRNIGKCLSGVVKSLLLRNRDQQQQHDQQLPDRCGLTGKFKLRSLTTCGFCV